MDTWDWMRVAFIVWQSIQAGGNMAGAQPAPPPPVAVATPVVRPRTTAPAPRKPVRMVSVANRPVPRDWFEQSTIAAHWPRERGRPKALPMDQFHELMTDMAWPYECNFATCSFPQTSQWAAPRVWLEVRRE